MHRVLLYLHGFLSSPGSQKAQQLKAYVAEHDAAVKVLVPALDDHPVRALQQATAAVGACAPARIGVVGSSLGGFWATHLANAFGLRAVLVNPAVDPHLLLAGMSGTHQNPYTGKQIEINHALVEACRQLQVTPAEPKRFWLLLQTADEILDYRQALQRYQGARITLEPGGSHAFDGFERYLGAILDFLFADEDGRVIAPCPPC